MKTEALPRIQETIAWLQDQTEQRGVLDGAQVCVIHHDEVLVNEAVGNDGRRRPLTVDTLGQLRCGVAKPLIGLTIASLVAEGACEWDTPINAILDGPFHPAIAAATLDDLLCHRAGAHTLPGILLNIRPPETRLAMAKMGAPPPGWKTGIDSAYSESCGALLTGEAIEVLTGREYQDVVKERIIIPSGVPEHMLQYRMTDEYFEAHQESIGVSSAEIHGMHVPYLIEGTREMATEWNPSWCGYSTAHGQALFFKYVLDLYKGRVQNPYLPPEIIQQVMWARPNEPEGTHQSNLLKMGRGFHHDLRLIQVPNRYAAGTFGHFGYAISVVFADIELDLVVGIRFTNQNEGHLQLMRLDRVINAIYSDVTGEDILS